jgi:hypothetical protein
MFHTLQVLGKTWECNGAVHYLFIDINKAHDSTRRGWRFSILTVFGIPMKLVWSRKSAKMKPVVQCEMANTPLIHIFIQNGM